ncbi:hypothetical protein [uncultured Nostoc sp.]|uniref:hypothetical protein n=1 Tax=uncultured Nostoc sp. TaxID=340711 RepID=UPI0035CC8C94
MLEVLQFGAATFPPTVAYIQPPALTAPPATLQNTVSVSPAPLYQPAHQNTGHREIFLASLIAGGLIGGSIIIGFALSKSPQSVVQSSVSSPTRDEVQDTPTPAQSPVSITPEPITSKEPQDQEVLSARSQFPSNNVTSPTQSAQLPSSTQPQINRLTPEQAVQNYFETINKRDFQTGWNQLSPSYQNNKRLHPDGYLSYIDWWGGKVQSVDIEQVSLVEASTQTATVNAKLKYLMNTGKVIPGSVRFFLLWDAQNSRWIVSDTK